MLVIFFKVIQLLCENCGIQTQDFMAPKLKFPTSISIPLLKIKTERMFTE